MELPTISSDSNWPMTISPVGGGLFSLPSSWTGWRLGKMPASVAGMSLLESGTTEKEMPRMVSLRKGLPASVHFLRSAARLVLSRSLLPLVSSSNSRPGAGIVPAVPAVLRDGEGQLALRQTGVVTELDAQILFQRGDEFFVPSGHELVVKRFHRRIVPEQPLRRLMGGSRILAKSGTVTSSSVSAGSRFSAGGMAARTDVASVSQPARSAVKMPAGCRGSGEKWT